MRTIAESLENVSGMKHPSRYPLQEPSVVSRKQMLKSQSMNGITIHPPQATTNISPSPPSRSQPLLSPRY
ncbi:serine threonine-protein kinase [Musa troglodytarum]|uniref:Serine threonine-protein kinase n=1 Tax=Musa troglodytarum TaxID=320322 RepID=A0A9E7JY65_9LILI|nr:serine threonine-protein kinase [Musa troglodytarum]